MFISRGEQLLRDILAFNIKNDNVFYNYRELGVVNDKTGYPLEIDIYYPDYKLAIEFQGESHYAKTEFSSEEDLQETIRRDKLKRDYCNQHGIHLLTFNAMELTSFLYPWLYKIIPENVLLRRPKHDLKQKRYMYYLESKCKSYRQYLNQKYENHTSAKSDARIWREEVKKRGIEIPAVLRKKTVIPQIVKDVVEAGKYDQWCMQIMAQVHNTLYENKYLDKSLRALTYYLPVCESKVDNKEDVFVVVNPTKRLNKTYTKRKH